MDDISDDELRKYVHNFLSEIKNLVLREGLFITERLKNRDALLELGLTARQREEEILTLSVANYCSGPHKDEYRPGHYWEFGKLINGIEVYIKLKIAEQSGTEQAVCLSFHKAEWTLNHPFI